MEKNTVLNPALQQSPQTLVNAEIIEAYNRQNNLVTDVSSLIDAGTVILEKYSVISRLEVMSGEADLFLCSDSSGTQYVAKVYKRKFAVKEEVTAALLGIDSPYVAKLFDTGTFGGYPVEILPYYANGSLQGKTFSEEELIGSIIPKINEGLRAIHEAGIIHKDLKPSNIMLGDDGETVSIIDFGISSSLEDGSTVLVTKTGMTPEYSAPETFKNIFLVESDYYSFGITLFELFCGYTPYANMQPEEIEQYVSVQRIPFPENMSAKLQDFISALTYYDISYRKNKTNPNRRWTYDEVHRWLEGEPLVIPGEGVGNAGKGAMPPYEFLGESYTDPKELVTALAKHWEDGKKQLFRGYITAHFRSYNVDIARKCQAAEEEAGRENGRDDIIFWRLLYQIDPKLQGFYWRGRVYESLPAFGREALEKLWDKDYSDFAYYAAVLSERVLSQYVSIAAPRSPAMPSPDIFP
ncbi:MAG: protein kinase, partial [Clostridia bacterium]|nr:protein kinase [Clostridia bacterium]